MKNAAKFALLFMMSAFILVSPVYAWAADADDHNGGIVKISGDIYVNKGDTVNGDVVTVWGNVYINGSVTGDAVTVLGDIIVNGEVLGDATAVRGKITLGPKGRILGSTVEALGGPISSRRAELLPDVNLSFLKGIGGRIFSFIFSLIVFLLAALVYLIMPSKAEEMADTIDDSLGRRMGIGFIAFIGSPVVMVLLSIVLAITIVGIIVIPFLWMAFMAASLVAVVPVYIYLGSKAGELISKQKIRGFGALAAGILSVWLIKTIIGFGGFFTGWINVIISLLILVLGLGTLLDYIFDRRKPRPGFAGYSAQWSATNTEQNETQYTGGAAENPNSSGEK